MAINKSWLLISLWILQLEGKIYNEDSLILYLPPNEPDSKYFGYSVLLGEDPLRLTVGAPEWRNEMTKLYSGDVFNCTINLHGGREQSCSPTASYSLPTKTSASTSNVKDYKVEMALGSSLVEISKGTLVLCAPRWSHKQENVNNESLQTVHGVCVTTEPNNKRHLNPFDLPENKQFKDIENSTDNRPYYSWSQAGFSSAVTQDKKTLLLGAPGLDDFKGGLATYSTEDFSKFSKLIFEEMKTDSYFGFSIGSSVFDPEKGEVLMIAGGPRGANYTGQVVIFSVRKNENDKIVIKANVTGDNSWEYFGASFLAVDLNNDGRQDLLVGAPQRSFMTSPECCFDQGVVYVYLNWKMENGFKLEKMSEVRGSPGNNARFGTSLADLGDIDGDGYTDIAIGAPFENTSNSDILGAVYIFKGGPNGLKQKYAEKLLPKSNRLNGFGFSLAKAVDVDKNGCRDIAAGGVLGNGVALLRCSPTFTVRATIDVLAQAVKDVSSCNFVSVLPNQTQTFNVSLCVDFDKTKDEWKQISQKMKFELHKNKRPIFQKVFDVSYNKPPFCHRHQVERQNYEEQIALNFDISQMPEEFNDGEFDMMRGYLSGDSALSSNISVNFADCGLDGRCVPDLHIVHAPLNSIHIPGVNDLGFELVLTNDGEVAFGTKLQITLPKEVRTKTLSGECSQKDNVIECNYKYLYKKDGAKTFRYKLESSSLSFLKPGPLAFSYTLHDCKKLVKNDNFIIDVKLQANITIGGNVQPALPQYFSQEDVKNKRIIPFNHKFYVINHGPSNYPDVTVDIKVPSEVFLKHYPLGCANGTTNGIVDGTVLRCLYQIPASEDQTISIDFLVHTELFEKYLYSETNFTSEALLVYGEFNKTIQLTTVLRGMEVVSGLKIWAIVLSVIAGLLIIAVIVYIMYKCKFFERRIKEKMEDGKANNGTGTPSADTRVPVDSDDDGSHHDPADPMVTRNDD